MERQRYERYNCSSARNPSTQPGTCSLLGTELQAQCQRHQGATSRLELNCGRWYIARPATEFCLHYECYDRYRPIFERRLHRTRIANPHLQLCWRRNLRS